MILAKDSRYIVDYAYTSSNDFLKAISYGGELYCVLDNNFIFRGHQSDRYKLIPTALRKNLMEQEASAYAEDKQELLYTLGMMEFGQVMLESQILFDFYNGCDNVGLKVPAVERYTGVQRLTGDFASIFNKEYWIPDDLVEIAALAQHYGLPTRLLDWTSDFYTAIYFAASGAMRDQTSPSLMTQAAWQQSMKDSINSQMTALQREMPIEPKAENKLEIWALDKRLVLLHNDELSLRIVRPVYEGNPNLCAQKGLFTYWEVLKPLKSSDKGVTPDFEQFVDKQSLDVKLTDSLLTLNETSKPYLYHITIPVSGAKDLYRFVSLRKTDASTLFPGYYGVVRKMEEDKMAQSQR